MKITKDVIADLMPLYPAGEVSADTRALVEDFLKANPWMLIGPPVEQVLMTAPPPVVEREAGGVPSNERWRC